MNVEKWNMTEVLRSRWQKQAVLDGRSRLIYTRRLFFSRFHAVITAHNLTLWIISLAKADILQLWLCALSDTNTNLPNGKHAIMFGLNCPINNSNDTYSELLDALSDDDFDHGQASYAQISCSQKRSSWAGTKTQCNTRYTAEIWSR